ncbi:hypothetical protein [Bacteroides caccae]|uniref:hypothetical protein n=1 Tax=Bacteroides caccae TaxID=47678 RepID=UPI003D7BC04F
MVSAVGSVIFLAFLFERQLRFSHRSGIFCAGMPYLRCAAVRGVRVGEAVEVP